MNFLINENSIHKQFKTISSFNDAFKDLIFMRKIVEDNNCKILCNRSMWNNEPVLNINMRLAIFKFDSNTKKIASNWISRNGPFWDDERKHNLNEIIECNGNDVANTGIGEAGYRVLNGLVCYLISIKPSDWDDSPIIHVNYSGKVAEVENFSDKHSLKKKLNNIKLPLSSWNELQITSNNQFKHLVFFRNCFDPLQQITFVERSADGIYFLLDLLNKLIKHTDKNGQRSYEANEIFSNFFKRKNAKFTDSSTKEINKFKNKLTFLDPTNPNLSIFCPWHGKVSHKNLRIHFNWPIEPNGTVYIVYIGPKLTKK